MRAEDHSGVGSPGGGETGFLHDRVAGFVRDLIRDGTLAPGDRVPSLREIRRRFGVSMATATRAYETLEEAGWIEARPQSGFYVRTPRGIALAGPGRGEPPGRPERVDVASLVRGLVSDGGDSADVVTLSLAHPDSGGDLLPTKALQRSVTRVMRRDPEAAIRYSFMPGSEALRRQIAFRTVDAGCRVHPDEILVTSGCAEAVSIALQCVAGPGGVVAVESPTFFNFLTLIETLGMRALELPTDPRTGIDLDALERSLAAGQADAVLVVPNFSNPLGSCMPDAHKQRLAALAARYEVPVVEDDIYGDVYYTERRPPLVRAFEEAGDGCVLTASSFSKTIAPGYRVGWLLPRGYGDRAMSIKHAMSVASASLSQLAIADFLDNGGYDRHLKRIRRRYRDQVERMRYAIARHFPEGTRVTDPQGGFLLWVQLPPGTSGVAVYHAALEQGIRVAPGSLFSTAGAYDSYLRLSCGASWTPAVEEAVQRLGRIVTGLVPAEPADPGSLPRGTGT